LAVGFAHKRQSPAAKPWRQQLCRLDNTAGAMPAHPTCGVADLKWSRYLMTRRGHAIPYSLPDTPQISSDNEDNDPDPFCEQICTGMQMFSATRHHHLNLACTTAVRAYYLRPATPLSECSGASCHFAASHTTPQSGAHISPNHI
jgi:hypothetical protein